MTVAEYIIQLQALPQDAQVYLYDLEIMMYRLSPGPRIVEVAKRQVEYNRGDPHYVVEDYEAGIDARQGEPFSVVSL
jgi:hypothetical protein